MTSSSAPRVLRRAGAVTAAAALVTMTLLTAAATAQEVDRLRIVAADVAEAPAVALTVEVPGALRSDELDAEHFTLTEDGVPVDISVGGTGSATDAADLEVVLVVDVSGSMDGEPLAAAQEAAATLVEAMPERTAFAVVAFGDEPEVISPLAVGRSAALGAIDELESGGSTALYDALVAGVAEFADASRHALVLLTDGADTASETTLDEATEAIAAGGIEFAAIELLTPAYDGAVMAEMADAAGGEILSTETPGELAALYTDVAERLVDRYLVTYESNGRGVTDVALTVTAGDVIETTRAEIDLAAPNAPIVLDPAGAAPVAEPGWFASPAALAVVSVLCFLLLASGIGWLILRDREPTIHLSRGRTRKPSGDGLRGAFAAVAERGASAIERRLASNDGASRLDLSLERAGIALRPGEFGLVAAGSVVGGLLVGLLLGGPLFGLLLAVVVGAGFPLYVRFRIKRRLTAFGDQLSDTLQLLTGSLRAGHALLQALDSVAGDAQSPTKDEFQRLVMEVRVGRPFGDALRAMGQRIGNEDFEAVVQAVEIQREVGGDLSEILETVGTTVRERAYLHRQVDTLAAEGKLSAVILLVLPFGVGGFIALINPEYLAPLFGTGIGIGLLVAAAAVLGVGFLWIRKLVQMDY